MVFSNVILIFMVSLQIAMYGTMIDNTLRTSTGHLQIQARGYKDQQKIRQSVTDVAALAARMREELELEDVAPRAAAFALVSSAERSYGIQIVGVEPESERRVSNLPGLIRQGRFFDDARAPEIVIGQLLARNLRVSVGDELTLLGSGRDGSFAAAVMSVVGVFESGNPDLDRLLAQVPLAFFQDTFAMEADGHNVVLFAPSLFQVSALKERVSASLPPDDDLVVLEWDALMPGLKQAIQADMSGGWFMYAVLIVLVAFSVLNTQLMSVLERTKEFGIVLSLGLTPGRLGRLVLLETTLMGLVGLLLGMLLGGALVTWFSIYGLAFPGLEQMAGKFNLPDRVYMEVTALGLLLGPLLVLISSLLAALYPMARLRRIEPVEAMRAA